MCVLIHLKYLQNAIKRYLKVSYEYRDIFGACVFVCIYTYVHSTIQNFGKKRKELQEMSFL